MGECPDEGQDIYPDALHEGLGASEDTLVDIELQTWIHMYTWVQGW